MFFCLQLDSYRLCTVLGSPPPRYRMTLSAYSRLAAVFTAATTEKKCQMAWLDAMQPQLLQTAQLGPFPAARRSSGYT